MISRLSAAGLSASTNITDTGYFLPGAAYSPSVLKFGQSFQSRCSAPSALVRLLSLLHCSALYNSFLQRFLVNMPNLAPDLAAQLGTALLVAVEQRV